jgi:DNA-binding transcriptional MerR regulator
MSSAKTALPDKLYFKIGEVARLVGVKPYVLRYWESEFSMIRPGKTQSKHRLYRRRDVETLLEIKQLLHAERYTIEGAKRRLKGVPRPAGEAPEREQREQLALPLGERTYREALVVLRREIQALHKLLS